MSAARRHAAEADRAGMLHALDALRAQDGPPTGADWTLLHLARRHLRRPEDRPAIVAAHAAAAGAHALRWWNSTEAPGEILDLLGIIARGAIGGAIFWRVVAQEWTGFDAIPHAAYAAAFRRHRAAWSPDCMAPADRAAWDALPEVVTLYRGQPSAAPPGLSWTLRREVAEGFARGHRGIPVPSPAILRASVPRDAVAFCSTERDEAEAMLFAPPARGAVEAEPAP